MNKKIIINNETKKASIRDCLNIALANLDSPKNHSKLVSGNYSLIYVYRNSKDGTKILDFTVSDRIGD